MPYDAPRDSQPVSLIASAPLLVVVHPLLPVNSIEQLVALAKTKPKIRVEWRRLIHTSGNGDIRPDVGTELLNQPFHGAPYKK